MASLASIAAQQTAGAARETFGKVFDPFGTKATQAEREKASLSLQQEQIMTAQLQRKLKEDAVKAQKQLQKLQFSNFNPEVVADVYNDSGLFDGEYMFDKQHFNETKAKDGLGEIKFRKGTYSRTATGEREKHDDGTFIFSPEDAGKDITFESSTDMQSHLTGNVFDPKIRLAQLLNKEEFELFKKKTAVKETSEGKLIEQRGKIQIEKAKIYAGAQAGATKKGLTEKQRRDLEIKDLDQQIEVMTGRINTAFGEEGEVETRFTRDEMKKVNKIVGHEAWDRGIEAAKKDPSTGEKFLKELRDLKAPEDWVRWIELKIEPDMPEKAPEKKKGFFGTLLGN